MSSGAAAICNATSPVLTALVMRAVGGSGRLPRHKVAGIAVGLLGVAVLVGPEALGGGALGYAACLAAAGSYALSAPVMARVRHLPPLTVAASQLTASTLLLLPLAALADRFWALPAPSPLAWAALGGLALFSTALAYVIYFRLVSSAGPANAMLVTYLIPVTALVLGNLLLREPITGNAVAGAAIILAGLAVLDGRWLARAKEA